MPTAKPKVRVSLVAPLRYCGVPFDRADLETFGADVWPLAEVDPEPGRWASEFIEVARQPA